MGPSAAALISSTVAGSALLPKYGTAVDGVSAYEKLTGKASAGALPDGGTTVPDGGALADGGGTDTVDAEARRIEEEILGRPSSRPAPRPEHQAPHQPRRRAPEQAGGGVAGDVAGALGGALGSGLQSMARSLGTQLGRELLRGVFGTSSKRRRR
jgi:hypothetical protein